MSTSNTSTYKELHTKNVKTLTVLPDVTVGIIIAIGDNNIVIRKLDNSIIDLIVDKVNVFKVRDTIEFSINGDLICHLRIDQPETPKTKTSIRAGSMISRRNT